VTRLRICSQSTELFSPLLDKPFFCDASLVGSSELIIHERCSLAGPLTGSSEMTRNRTVPAMPSQIIPGEQLRVFFFFSLLVVGFVVFGFFFFYLDSFFAPN